MSEKRDSLAEDLIGTWRLIDRIDRAADGTVRPEPTLGSDPLAMLTYTGERFSAQFMKRVRQTNASDASTAAGRNNTSAVDGYDAYFGTYQIIGAGVVRHKLEAALSPGNIGMEVERTLAVVDDQLTITLATTTRTGEPVTRTLRWNRVR